MAGNYTYISQEYALHTFVVMVATPHESVINPITVTKRCQLAFQPLVVPNGLEFYH